MKRSVINVLEADPDLATGLEPEAAALARGYALARMVTIPAGAWRPTGRANPGDLGLLVLDGAMMCRTALSNGRTGIELVGDSDLIRPWDRDWGDGSLRIDVRWRALTDVRIADLDRRFTARIGRWPPIVSALTQRASRRAHWMAVIDAVAHATRVDLRILVLLWCIADRWGRVDSNGTVVPFELTHNELAALVGAQRPSVSLALKELSDAGLLTRHPTGGWLLPTAGADAAVASLSEGWVRRLPGCVIEKVRNRLPRRARPTGRAPRREVTTVRG